ncbi:MAG: hypothetical protein ABIP93_06410 [Gemmatimonadaceae bacterium]
MTDRNQNDDHSSAKSAPNSAKTDRTIEGRDDGTEQEPQKGAEQSTASRPRGQTEDPDKTL